MTTPNIEPTSLVEMQALETYYLCNSKCYRDPHSNICDYCGPDIAVTVRLSTAPASGRSRPSCAPCCMLRRGAVRTKGKQMEQYLGDGLYASFDGYQITLRAPRTNGDHWVALEPEVYFALQDFALRIWGPMLQKKTGGTG